MDYFSHLPFEVIQIIINKTFSDDLYDVHNVCLACKSWNTMLSQINWRTYFLSGICCGLPYSRVTINRKFIVTHGKYLYRLDDPEIINQWYKHKTILDKYQAGQKLEIYFLINDNSGYAIIYDSTMGSSFKFSVISDHTHYADYVDMNLLHDYFISCLTKCLYSNIEIIINGYYKNKNLGDINYVKEMNYLITNKTINFKDIMNKMGYM